MHCNTAVNGIASLRANFLCTLPAGITPAGLQTSFRLRYAITPHPGSIARVSTQPTFIRGWSYDLVIGASEQQARDGRKKDAAKHARHE
jgi:hypothetical protein